VTVGLGPVLTESVSDPLTGNSGSNCPVKAPPAASTFYVTDPIMTVWVGLQGLTPQSSVQFVFSYNGAAEPTLGWNYVAGSFQSGYTYVLCPSVGTAPILGVWGQNFATLFPGGGGAGPWTLGIYVNGSSSPITNIPFTILANSQAGLAITSVSNAATHTAGIAPNSWVEIKGSNLAPPGDSRVWQGSDFVNNQMPTQLDGVSVTMNSENAYMYFASPAQVNVLTPADLAAGPVQVKVTAGGVTSAAFTGQAQEYLPSFFLFGPGPYVLGTHLNGSDLGPTSLYPGLTTPAAPGEQVILYGTGFGPVSPPVVAGSAAQFGSLPVLPVVKIGGLTALVYFAGLVSPGLYQFNVVVPAAAPSGDNVLTAQYAGLYHPERRAADGAGRRQHASHLARPGY
jgi:uncharacterized protein (TIGR03437 family)